MTRASLLGDRLEGLRQRSVLLAIRDPLLAALALIELDGVARRMVLCPPDLPARAVPAVIERAQADVWLGESLADAHGDVSSPALERIEIGAGELQRLAHARRASCETEWILLSSGTTGIPKLIAHTLASLCAALRARRSSASGMVWSTFYDIRRYGGLQILLRALHGGPLVLRDAAESVAQFLARAGRLGVTHISGTPSHWRGALMSGAAAHIMPRYVRLSGEIADQGILDNLRAVYPEARIVHAFASTEAGVAFEVEDGAAGFPVNLLAPDAALTGVELKIVDDTLRIRSPGNARGYLGGSSGVTAGDGFVDTGDRVELRGDRYYFIGRAGGIINVGGLKVHPEEVEAVINTHPAVRMSRVSARRSPITGAIVVAEVLPVDPLRLGAEALMREIMALCRGALPAHKVPATVRIVERLQMSAAGKLMRVDT